jgi:hypothetical protein
LDDDGLSHNPSPLEEDLTGARWHGTCDQDIVLGWHASSYLAWMEGRSNQDIEEIIEDVVDEDLDERGPRITFDVWKDQRILHCLQHREILPNTLPQERKCIAHRMARFH